MEELELHLWELTEVATVSRQTDYRTFKQDILDGEVTGDRIPHVHTQSKIKIPIKMYKKHIEEGFTPEECRTCKANRTDAEPIVKPLRQVVSNK